MSVFAIRSCEGWSGPLIVFDQRDFERLQSSSAAAVEPSMSRTLEYRRCGDMKSAAQFLAESYESAFLEQMMVDSRPSNEAAVPISAKATTPITPSVVAGGTEKINGSDPSGSPVATIRNSPTPAPTKKRKIANQESTVATAALPSVGGIAGEMAVPSTTTIPVAAAGNFGSSK
eukprot:scaffold4767_cov86-Cylindrotheca_fusiformis.AAC.2